MIERIELNDELKMALSCGVVKARVVVEWLIQEHGFASTKDIANTSLSTLTKGGASIAKAQFDRLEQELVLTYK